MRVEGELLAPDEVLGRARGRRTRGSPSPPTETSASSSTRSSTTSSLREGRVFDLTHAVNVLRKERGLEVTDRIVLTLPEADRDLLAYEERIKAETLAVELRPAMRSTIEKA